MYIRSARYFSLRNCDDRYSLQYDRISWKHDLSLRIVTVKHAGVPSHIKSTISLTTKASTILCAQRVHTNNKYRLYLKCTSDQFSSSRGFARFRVSTFNANSDAFIRNKGFRRRGFHSIIQFRE